ncbi:MAG: hypothetical protein C0592_09110 [Marinilabiliales bacterium]|nr:MAG: hypothetical protein C0592_09110 [Marinilabiliales bacterium]
MRISSLAFEIKNLLCVFLFIFFFITIQSNSYGQPALNDGTENYGCVWGDPCPLVKYFDCSGATESITVFKGTHMDMFMNPNVLQQIGFIDNSFDPGKVNQAELYVDGNLSGVDLNVSNGILFSSLNIPLPAGVPVDIMLVYEIDCSSAGCEDFFDAQLNPADLVGDNPIMFDINSIHKSYWALSSCLDSLDFLAIGDNISDIADSVQIMETYLSAQIYPRIKIVSHSEADISNEYEVILIRESIFYDFPSTEVGSIENYLSNNGHVMWSGESVTALNNPLPTPDSDFLDVVFDLYGVTTNFALYWDNLGTSNVHSGGGPGGISNDMTSANNSSSLWVLSCLPVENRVFDINGTSDSTHIALFPSRPSNTGVGTLVFAGERGNFYCKNSGSMDTDLLLNIAKMHKTLLFGNAADIANMNTWSSAAEKTNCGTLPIELISFAGMCNTKKQTCLNWSTAAEINNDFFTVERSSDAIQWEDIANISGAGNSNTVQNYSFTDKNATEEKYFYRLKQTDFDGQYSYSDVILVENCDNNCNNINVYPNPVKEDLYLETSCLEEGNVSIKIYNTYGEMKIFEESHVIRDYNRIRIDVSELDPGLYLLLFENDDVFEEIKFIKTDQDN